MITLKEALKLTKISENECCYFKTDYLSHYDVQILTLKEIKDKYDLKNTMVVGISPRFLDGDYRGIEFELKETS